MAPEWAGRSLAIALSSFADSFLRGRSCLAVPSPAVVQQTDFFLPPEVRKGIGTPRLEVFQKRRRVPRPDGFLVS